MEENDVYVRLVEKLNYPNPNSSYLIGILKKMATVDDAKLLMELPAAPGILAAKTGLSEGKVLQRIEELTEKGLIVPSREGPRFLSSVTQFHDGQPLQFREMGGYRASGSLEGVLRSRMVPGHGQCDLGPVCPVCLRGARLGRY